MGRFVDTNPSRRLRNLVLPAVALFTLPLVAQKSPDTPPPKYDISTETKMKATVEEMKIPAKPHEIVHLLVKIGADTVDVYLCPKSFLDDMGTTYTKGDEISILGAKVKQGETDLILAREVAKGTDTLILRDNKGNPVWSWRH
jgi:hypothetical protein